MGLLLFICAVVTFANSVYVAWLKLQHRTHVNQMIDEGIKLLNEQNEQAALHYYRSFSKFLNTTADYAEFNGNTIEELIEGLRKAADEYNSEIAVQEAKMIIKDFS